MWRNIFKGVKQLYSPTLFLRSRNTTSNMADLVSKVVCRRGDMNDGEMQEVELEDGVKCLLVKEGGKFHAVGHKCTHYGAPLVKGSIGNGHVRCPWHGACFNLETGDIEDFPGVSSIQKFSVSVANDEVKVTVSRSAAKTTKRDRVKGTDKGGPHYVIVGGGPAAFTCSEILREEGFSGRITMLSKEANVTYDRPKLSKALSIKADDILLRPQSFYKEAGVDFRTNCEVVSVNSNNKKVVLKSGEEIKYDKLCLATGATPREATFVEGHELGNIFTLRTVEEANAIAAEGDGKKVVIIGTSFIGVEVAAAITSKAESVAIVDLVEAPFQLALGKEVGALFKKMLEDKGVKFYFKNSAAKFVGEGGKIKEIVLKDGQVLQADMCVVGIGVGPATQFLKDSGLSITDRGFVTVDKHMKTNLPDVYAAGDITHFPLFFMNNDHVNVQHWQMAHKQGQIAALNMVGKSTPIKSVPFFWTVIFGKSLRYCGYGVGYDDIVIHGDLEGGKFVAYYTKGDRVIAVASLNYDPIVSQVAEFLLHGETLTKLEVQSSPDAWTSKLYTLNCGGQQQEGAGGDSWGEWMWRVCNIL